MDIETQARLRACEHILPKGYEILQTDRIRKLSVQTSVSMYEVEQRYQPEFKDYMRGSHIQALATQLAEIYEPQFWGEDKASGTLRWRTDIKVIV